MKFFIAFVAFVAVAAAMPRNKPFNHLEEELAAIIEAINSPSTDPATAILLQEQLDAILGVEKPEGIDTSPVIVEEAPEVPSPVLPEPAPVAPAPASSPIVQIIVNVGTGSVISPVIVDRPIPEQVVHDINFDPVIVEEPVEPSEPVLVAPIVPAPVVVIPDILN